MFFFPSTVFFSLNVFVSLLLIGIKTIYLKVNLSSTHHCLVPCSHFPLCYWRSVGWLWKCLCFCFAGALLAALAARSVPLSPSYLLLKMKSAVRVILSAPRVQSAKQNSGGKTTILVRRGEKSKSERWWLLKCAHMRHPWTPP